MEFRPVASLKRLVVGKRLIYPLICLFFLAMVMPIFINVEDKSSIFDNYSHPYMHRTFLFGIGNKILNFGYK